MLLLDQYGIQGAFYRHFADVWPYTLVSEHQRTMAAQFHFTLSCLVLFVLVPLLYATIFPVHDIYRYGLSLKPESLHIPLYSALLLLVLPAVWIASSDPGFAQFYPMYKPTAASDWMLYEVTYMLQFFAVEFFFRGYCLFRLERFVGLYAVPLMVIPYALLHIHKPLPEAFGSIIAGMILGYLAIRTRSIWPGLILHCAVALSMDTFSLLRSGWFGSG